ncbi:LlaJI family restriction endonuclease [Entomomonas sp. E2T0]|uniref:LlaJI family restriction endonuclease n=1 Tax=Entomomonas sp. E2T0 TaxID=2930213 RepID=UPI00222822F6|nr:LlaJI family restriction endonuclease [Entomomonas sp. E2T0]UYZ84704.1 LlaJI family restriction endonuclease [Entomomonas sp. E2T0]
MTPYFYNDSMHSNKLPKSLLERMQSLDLIRGKKSDKTVCFCGIIIIKKEIHLFLPRSISLDNKDLKAKKKLAANFIQSIEKYGKQSKTKVDLQDDGEGRIGLIQLSLIKTLLKDYQDYGLYVQRQESQVTNAGKTNWAKTIKKIPISLNKKKQVVYLKLYGNKYQFLTGNIVSQIHADIIRELNKKYSWLFFNKNEFNTNGLNNISSLNKNTDHKLSILNSELSNSYSERDINLIKNMINYLKNISGDDTSELIAGVTKFHHAWEHMLKKILANTIDINSKLPIPIFTKQNDEIIKISQKGMKTDIVIEDKKEQIITVVDAKYYEAQNVNTMPSWPDIVKQFFYIKALKTIYPSDYQFKNIFIFPGENKIFKQINMGLKDQEYILLDEDFPPIICKYICPIIVIDYFVKNKTVDLIDL